MNESGAAVRKCIDYYEIRIDDLIVVSDDVALTLGEKRMREKGSSGGHNGLKSIAMHLNSEHFPRFRIGVGSPSQGKLKDYILETFKRDEASIIEEVVTQAVDALKLWVTLGIAAAMRETNKSTCS